MKRILTIAIARTAAVTMVGVKIWCPPMAHGCRREADKSHPHGQVCRGT